MAAGPIETVPVPVMANGANIARTLLSEEEEHMIKECQKIIKLRDEVLAGAHPRIKMTAHLVATKQAINDSRGPVPLSGVAAVSSGMTAPVKVPPTGPKSKQKQNAKLARANGHAKAAIGTIGPHSQTASNTHSFNVNSQQSVATTKSSFAHLPGLNSYSSAGTISSSMAGVPTGPRADIARRIDDGAAGVQFDPILLTKSEDLIKAEIQLQRRRLESALGDQVQQQRAAAKASHANEALADFVLAEVLMKALQLVQSSAPPQTDPNLAANTSGADSESADGNSTFYSSKHDTPESHMTHLVADLEEDVEDAEIGEGSPYEPPMVMEASPVPLQPLASVLPPSTSIKPPVTQYRSEQHHALATQPNNCTSTTFTREGEAAGITSGARGDIGVSMEIISSQESGEASSSRDSRDAGQDQSVGQERLQSVTQHLIEHSFGRQQAPILRAHNLSPIAPQPAHVSPLATSRQPPPGVLAQRDVPQVQATPAQIVALRNDQSNGSSPESSPSGKPGKKGKKGKKRKAERMAATNATSPYIKPEPRSPSPINVPQFSRPNKRLRHGQGQQPTQEIDGVVESAHPPHSYPSRYYRDDRGPAHDSPLGQHVRQDSRPIVLTEASRYEREYRDDRRPVETVRYIRRVSPGAHSYPYAGTEVRTMRSVSHAPVERSYPHYEAREPARTVARSGLDRDRSRSPIMVDELPHTPMGPPQLPTTRVVVDEFGREYIDPSPRPEPVVIRRSVAPRPVYADHDEYYDSGRPTARIIRRSVAPASASIYGEPEVVYERAPPARAASTMPGSNRYDEEVMYRGPASPAGYATSRRVVTRAEYAPEYRYYRERDYASGPSQSGGYYEMRSTQPRPPVEEQPREYIIRSTTVRPEMTARQEVMRTASVRPEPVPGDYGAPIHLDAMPPPQPRAYSVRPMAPPPVPQQPQYVRQWPEYDVRPTYGEQEARGDDSGVTYVDAPREVYR